MNRGGKATTKGEGESSAVLPEARTAKERTEVECAPDTRPRAVPRSRFRLPVCAVRVRCL
jgi:hypothetical protein